MWLNLSRRLLLQGNNLALLPTQSFAYFQVIVVEDEDYLAISTGMTLQTN
jgi:hypothetical protein